MTGDTYTPLLNSYFITLVTRVCERLVHVFLDPSPSYLYQWEFLLKTLELLIPRLPQTLFYIRSLRMSQFGWEEEDLTLVQFIIRKAVLTHPERLQSFLTQYISESSYLTQQVTSEVLTWVLEGLMIPQDHFHSLQTLTLLTHLLINTEVAA